ncbi:MAG: amidase [Myxococcales bacterium]|nr:amidase [Myxococcales bacterium]
MNDELCFESASTLARRVARKDLSPVELVDTYIARIESCDAHYGAYLTLAFEQARAQAVEAEATIMAGKPLGLLHGVPVAVKDLLDTAGIKTTCGSSILASNVPDASATAVLKLEREGAILLGKLHMREFAGAGYHPSLRAPHNPHDPRRSTGGSSTGSAVAVAAGLCGAALGSDTVTSIRNPAHWNGCVGLKPTYGRVSRHGVYPLAHSLDHIGPMTRTVEDAALLLRVLSGHDPKDPTSLRGPLPEGWPSLAPPKRLRVGFDEAWSTIDVAPAVVHAVQEALSALETAGAEIVPVTVPLLAEAAGPFGLMLLGELGVAHRQFYPKRAEDYGPGMRGMLETTANITVDHMVQGHQFRMAFADAIRSVFTQVDLLVTPVGPVNAAPLDQENALTSGGNGLHTFRFAYPWNIVGAPALALPWGLDDEHMPNSVQLVGPVLSDALVLAAAHSIERPMLRPPALTEAFRKTS